jgi:predicted RNase H-like nuclease (RuvC/YqgF family)
VISPLNLSLFFNAIQAICLLALIYRALRNKHRKRYSKDSKSAQVEATETSEGTLILKSEERVEQLRLQAEQVQAEIDTLKQEYSELNTSVVSLRRLGLMEYQKFWEDLPEDLKDEIAR